MGTDPRALADRRNKRRNQEEEEERGPLFGVVFQAAVWKSGGTAVKQQEVFNEKGIMGNQL